MAAAQDARALPTPGLTDTVLTTFDASYWNTTLAPIWNRKMAQKYGDQGIESYMLLYNMAQKEGVQNDKGFGWEKGLIDRVFRINANVADPGAGNNLVVVVAAADVDSLGNSYPREGDEYMLTNNLVVGRVISKSTTTVTLRPKIATDNFGAVTAASSIFVCVGSSWDEGTLQPDSVQSYWYKYNWRVQIMKDTYALSGSMKTNKPQWDTIAPISPMTGKSMGSAFTTEGTQEAEFRMFKRAALTFLWGQESTNTGVPRSSTGLDYEIGQRGYTHSLSGGPLEVADYRAISTEQTKRFAKNLFVDLLPLELYRTIKADIPTNLVDAQINDYTDRKIKNLFTAGDGMTATPGLDATFDYFAFTDDGFTHLLNRFQMFDDPTAMNANSTSPLRSRAWFLPTSAIENKFGGLQKRCQLKYKSMDGYSRLFEVTQDGRASSRKIGDRDWDATYLSCEIGYFFVGLEQFTRVTA